MLHLLDGFPAEGYDDALSCIINGLLVLVCGFLEVTQSEGWHETPALGGTPHGTAYSRVVLAMLARTETVNQLKLKNCIF